MKTVRTKHHQRKSGIKSHTVALSVQGATDFWELDHDHPDPDLLAFSLQRSPKQENL